MTESIFSRQLMRNRGAEAFKQGKGIDDHGHNPGAYAIGEWQQGWDQAKAEAKASAKADRELCGVV